MYRLKHGGVALFGIYVATCWKAQAPLERAAQIGEYITKEVRGNHHIERFGSEDHASGKCINQIRGNFYVRVITVNISHNLVPEDHAIVECIALCAISQYLTPNSCLFKGVSDYALGT